MSCPHVRPEQPMCFDCVRLKSAERKAERAREDAEEAKRIERLVSDYTRVVGTEGGPQRAPAAPAPDKPSRFGHHTRSVGELPRQPLDFDEPHHIGRRFTGGRDIDDFVQEPVYASGPRRRRRR